MLFSFLEFLLCCSLCILFFASLFCHYFLDYNFAYILLTVLCCLYHAFSHTLVYVLYCLLSALLLFLLAEGSLEVKLPTIWRDEKAVSREKSQKRKDHKKEDAGARKGRKVAKHCVFSWFCSSGGLKIRLAKAAGAETFGEMRH